MGYDRPPREMHDATCGDCGKECQVPFEPRQETGKRRSWTRKILVIFSHSYARILRIILEKSGLEYVYRSAAWLGIQIEC